MRNPIHIQTIDNAWKSNKEKVVNFPFVINYFDELISETHDINWDKIPNIKIIKNDAFSQDKIKEWLQKPINYQEISKSKIEKIKSLKFAVDPSKFPSSLVQIGNSAFKGTKFINRVLDLQKTKIKIISRKAFQGCDLNKVIFPETLNLIDKNAFDDNNINSLDISNLPDHCSIKPEAFSRNDELYEKRNIKKRDSQSLTFMDALDQPNLIKKVLTNDSVANRENTKEIKNLRKKIEEEKSLNKTKDSEINSLQIKLKNSALEVSKAGKIIKKNQEEIARLKKSKDKVDDSKSNNKNKNNQIKELEEKNLKFQSKIKEFEDKKQGELKEKQYIKERLGAIINDKLPVEQVTKTLYDAITSQFFYLIKDIENLFIPYLVKFENRLRSRFTEYFRNNEFTKTNPIYNNNEFKNTYYSLDDLVKELRGHDESLRFLNTEKDGQPLFKEQLVKLSSCVEKESFKDPSSKVKSEWNERTINSLNIAINDIKQIRNQIIHTADPRDLSVVSDFHDTFKRKIAVYNNERDKIDLKSRRTFYDQISIGVFLDPSKSTHDEIVQYPTLICLLTFFNSKYSMQKLLADIFYLVNNFSAFANFTVIDRKKVLDFLDLNPQFNATVEDFIKRISRYEIDKTYQSE